jgi:hypothetical protein
VREIELKSNCTFSESNHAWERKSDLGEEERESKNESIKQRAEKSIRDFDEGEIDLGA